MSAPIVFLDLETTGLALDDHIWDAAVIRRDEHGQSSLQFFVEHSIDKAAQLPESFKADHDARYDAAHAVTPQVAARLLHRYLAPASDGTKAHVVGAVPNFDTERLARLFALHDLEPNWHYHLVDVETLAVGWLRATAGRAFRGGPEWQLPWNSDGLSRSLGVAPPTTERHTAMGDATWVMDMYDAMSQAPIGEVVR